MRTSTVLLITGLLASVASAAWLWNELDAERAYSAELSARLAPRPKRSHATRKQPLPRRSRPLPRLAERAAAGRSRSRKRRPRARTRTTGASPAPADERSQVSRGLARTAAIQSEAAREKIIELLGSLTGTGGCDDRTRHRPAERQWQQQARAASNDEGTAGAKGTARSGRARIRRNCSRSAGPGEAEAPHEYMEKPASRMQVDSIAHELAGAERTSRRPGGTVDRGDAHRAVADAERAAGIPRDAELGQDTSAVSHAAVR